MTHKVDAQLYLLLIVELKKEQKQTALKTLISDRAKLWRKDAGIDVGAVEELGVAELLVAVHALLGRVVGHAGAHALRGTTDNVVSKASSAFGSEAKLFPDTGKSAVVLSKAAGGALVKLSVQGVPLLLEDLEVLGVVAADVLVVGSLSNDGGGNNKEAECELHYWMCW